MPLLNSSLLQERWREIALSVPLCLVNEGMKIIFFLPFAGDLVVLLSLLQSSIWKKKKEKWRKSKMDAKFGGICFGKFMRQHRCLIEKSFNFGVWWNFNERFSAVCPCDVVYYAVYYMLFIMPYIMFIISITAVSKVQLEERGKWLERKTSSIWINASPTFYLHCGFLSVMKTM